MKKIIFTSIFTLMLLGLCSCFMAVDPCEEGHTPVSYTKIQATCSQEGKVSVMCSVCAKELSTDIVPKTAHASFETITTDPTCISEGKIIQRCTECRQDVSTESIPKLAHTPLETWETTVENGCTIDGERVNKCEVCDEIIETEVIPAAHSPIILKAISPTCYSEGYTQGSKCSECDEILKEQQRIDKIPHNFETVSAKEPTCAEYGYTEGTKCTMCSKWDIEADRIEKLPHTEVYDEAEEATCTENGLTDGKHCTVCQEATEPQKTIPMLGHLHDVYHNTCSRCGENQYQEITSRLELLDDYDGTYDAVIYLDKCITASNESEHWTITIKSTANYVRLVGKTSEVYCLKLDIASRQNDLTIDFVNVSMKCMANEHAIKSESKIKLTLGFYGESCSITGKTGSAGQDASLSSLTYDGGNGGNGYNAISIAGDLVIKNGADSVKIKGGNGGNGGKGMNSAPSPQDGGDGGNGGNGAYAISASSITVIGVDGHSSNSIVLAGGNGGSGGSGGSGFLFYDDGKRGSAGISQSATTVTPVYN